VVVDLEAEFDGFFDSRQKLVQRSRLGVAAGERRDRGHIVSLFVLLDYNVELTHHEPRNHWLLLCTSSLAFPVRAPRNRTKA
jgi:hypothetical protein